MKRLMLMLLLLTSLYLVYSSFVERVAEHGLEQAKMEIPFYT
jgi:hypothetical protein